MRYALDWCLFGYPQGDKEIASAQCTTACGRISSALEISLPNASASSTYDYCQDPEFLPNVGSCASCYKIVPNQLYMSNCKYSSLVNKACSTKIRNAVLNTLEYACQIQPSPVLQFPVKPSNIFTDQPPSNFSTLGTSTSSTSSHGLSHEARVAIAITVPVVVFLIFSLLLVYFYVHKNAPKECLHHCDHHSSHKHHYSEKHVSKSTSAWSKSSPRKGAHSRNRSSNSGSHQVPYPAPLKPSKVAVPAPLRTRNSPIPFSRNYYQPTNYGLEKPSKPPPPVTYSPEILPATRYSPPHPNSPTLEPQKTPRPGQSKPGLVSWERIAIQNAQIRAELGPSPSPISPLTKVQVVPIQRSPSQRSSSSKRERFPVIPSSPHSTQNPTAPREERRSALMRSPAPSSETRHSALTSPLSREETHPALRSPTLSEEMRSTLASPVSTEYYDPETTTPSRKESQDTTTATTRRNNSSPFRLRPGSISRQSTPFRQERQEAQEMVDRQEHHQQRRMGEIPEGEGTDSREQSPYPYERQGPGQDAAGRADATPRGSIRRHARGSSEGGGVMRSGSGRSVERGGARKEVRWSKDVDYEG